MSLLSDNLEITKAPEPTDEELLLEAMDKEMGRAEAEGVILK